MFRAFLSLLILGLLTGCLDGQNGFRSEIGIEETHRITKDNQLIVPDGIVRSGQDGKILYGYGFKVEEWICPETDMRLRYWLLPIEVFYILDTESEMVIFPTDRAGFEAALSQHGIKFDGDYSGFEMYRPITEYSAKWVKFPESCEKRPLEPYKGLN